MARHPVAHDGGKRPDLHIEAAVLPRRRPRRIFVQSNLGALIARIEAAIHPRLNKGVNVGTDLAIKKQGQPRIEEIVDLAVDQPGWRLLEMIEFQVDSPAHSGADRSEEDTSEIKSHS